MLSTTQQLPIRIYILLMLPNCAVPYFSLRYKRLTNNTHAIVCDKVLAACTSKLVFRSVAFEELISAKIPFVKIFSPQQLFAIQVAFLQPNLVVDRSLGWQFSC